MPEKPLEFLKRIQGRKIIVALKWGLVYEGIFDSCDEYMNIVLRNATSKYHDECRSLNDVLIRCNNIRTIREKP